MKAAAAVLAVTLVALGNVEAAHRERAQQLAASDRVDATLLAAAGAVHDQQFDLTLLVVNRGGRPITVQAARRLVPPLYDVLPVADRVVAAGATQEIAVRFRARCARQPEQPTQRMTMIVPIVPASGRVREVATGIDPAVLWDLSRRACGYLSADEAADPSVSGVTSTRYSVRFVMHLRNRSDQPFVLVDLTSPGLALSVRDGVPVGIARHAIVDLAVTVALPACSRLPAPGFGGRGAGVQRFATIVLVLRDENGAVRSKPFLPTAELSSALAGLRVRICPGWQQVPTPRLRPRFG